MNLKEHDHKNILNCEVKDQTGLNDFQKIPHFSGIEIPKVGIERYRLPVPVKRKDGTISSHDGEASMFVNLASNKTGVNMSRFCQILHKNMEAPIDDQYFLDTLTSFRSDLRDNQTEELIEKSYLSLGFNYPIKQDSLKSDNWGYQYYKCIWNGEQSPSGDTLLSFSIEYEYSSTCPCSLSMSKQYEKEFSQGLTKEGNGIATAHGQRSLATIKAYYRPLSGLHLEDVVELIRKALPTETQVMVKRVDEQAFAILNGENPMFVEHAVRRLSEEFSSEERILKWDAKVEHFESLHSHNAVAYISGDNTQTKKRVLQ